MTDARAPAADDIRIYERQRAGGNALKWDVCLVKGHFLHFLTRHAASAAIECWARDNTVYRTRFPGHTFVLCRLA